MFEEQKAAIEQRSRALLEGALHDAVFLAAANSQLKLHSHELKQGTHTHTQQECISVTSIIDIYV